MPPPLPAAPLRTLIDIMIFHLNLPQTTLEPYSNTAKVFPFQSKRKKKKIPYMFHNLYIAFPNLSLLMFLTSFPMLSVYIIPLLQTSKMSMSRHPYASCSLPQNALPLSNTLSSSVPSVSIIPCIASSLKSSISLLYMFIHHVYHTS